MGAQERLVDRGRRLGHEALVHIGAELRAARVGRGLSIDAVAQALGISNAQVSRIERSLAPNVPLVVLCSCATIVGLDLTIKAYPGPEALRDASQLELLDDFRGELHASVRWATEVPLPIPGDQRAWDGLVAGTGWRYGVEAETLPNDAQALVRRLNLKERDGDVDGVLLVVRDTRRVRSFLRHAAVELEASFPLPGPTALARLRIGQSPGGSAVIRIVRRVGARAS